MANLKNYFCERITIPTTRLRIYLLNALFLPGIVLATHYARYSLRHGESLSDIVIQALGLAAASGISSYFLIDQISHDGRQIR